jgi:DNA-binding response OmpR family regulator
MIAKGKKIVVYDPDPRLCVFYDHVLTAQGYRSLSASDQDHAMELLKREGDECALVIVDVEAPGEPGWDLIKKLKADSSGVGAIPILGIADYSRSMDIFDELKDACDVVIVKGDFEIPRFTEMVQLLIRKRLDPDEAPPFDPEKTRII